MNKLERGEILGKNVNSFRIPVKEVERIIAKGYRPALDLKINDLSLSKPFRSTLSQEQI